MSISLIERAVSAYERNQTVYTFEQDVSIYAALHWLYMSPEYIIMAREINKDARFIDIVDGERDAGTPNCWHIHLAVGSLISPLTLFPEDRQHKYFSFVRRNKLKIYTFNAFMSCLRRRIKK